MSQQAPEPSALITVAGRRTRKFPLTLHPTGQYCKKIRGKMYYFGKDKQEALQLYYKRASSLHAGQGDPAVSETSLTVRSLCNLYLDYQSGQVTAGEIKYRHYYDQQLYLRAFAKYIGPDKLVTEIATLELQGYRTKLITDKKAATTINNHLSAVKAMFNWAGENDVIDRLPHLKAVKRMKTKKVERQTFTAGEIRKLIDLAGVQMRAMIFLGLNCGFGCTDCAELQWDNLNLDERRVSFPRGKTGVQRNFTLWPETVEALRAVPVRGELVFYTKQGHTWVRRTNGKSEDHPLSKEFLKLMRKAEITARKGTGFYSLRKLSSRMRQFLLKIKL